MRSLAGRSRGGVWRAAICHRAAGGLPRRELLSLTIPEDTRTPGALPLTERSGREVATDVNGPRRH
jgi:hypothetical protein